jgi:pimeloyl-ACP methyl ester carboxylesterase
MAQDVVKVVTEVCALEKYANLRDKKYNIVGHSLGGKVALMVAAKDNNDSINVIIAMDPVDDKPQELTARRGSPTTDLNGTKAKQIHLLQSTKKDTWTPPQGKNATAIKETYPTIFVEGSSNYTFYINLGAAHMSYLDKNIDTDSKAAREYVHKLIRDHIGA